MKASSPSYTQLEFFSALHSKFHPPTDPWPNSVSKAPAEANRDKPRNDGPASLSQDLSHSILAVFVLSLWVICGTRRWHRARPPRVSSNSLTNCCSGDQGKVTFAESRIKLLLCDAPEGLGALDNCLEKSDFFYPLPRNRFLGSKVCYRFVQKAGRQRFRWESRQWWGGDGSTGGFRRPIQTIKVGALSWKGSGNISQKHSADLTLHVLMELLKSSMV